MCSISAARRVKDDRLRREREDESLEEEETDMRSGPLYTISPVEVCKVRGRKTFTMELAALVALTLLLGALVGLVALAVGRRKEEIRVEEQTAEHAGKKPPR